MCTCRIPDVNGLSILPATFLMMYTNNHWSMFGQFQFKEPHTRYPEEVWIASPERSQSLFWVSRAHFRIMTGQPSALDTSHI